MKTKLFLIYPVFIILTVFILSSCGDKNPTSNNEENTCGSPVEVFESFNPGFLSSLPVSSLNNGRRIYDFYKKYDSICTDEHVSVRYHGQIDTGSNIKLTGKTEWQIFWEKSDTGYYQYMPGFGVLNWQGENNVGLKQVFGDLPGEIFINVYVDIPSQGSLQADSIYLCQKLNNVGWASNYKYHKNSTTANLINRNNYKDITYNFENKSIRHEIMQVKLLDNYFLNNSAFTLIN